MDRAPSAPAAHRLCTGGSREMSPNVPDQRNYFARWRPSGGEFFGEENDVLCIFVKNNGKKN